jgi:hypothetical protein
MDDQAFFKKAKATFFHGWSSVGFEPKPCPYIVFDHFEVGRRKRVVVPFANHGTGPFQD